MTPLETVIDTYVRGRLGRGEITPTTGRHFRQRLASLASCFGDRPLVQLDRHAIEDWQSSIGHLAVASRKSYLSTISVFSEWLVLEGKLTANPCSRLPKIREPRRVPRALPADAVGNLLSTAVSERDRVMVLLMVGCGLRRAEIARLLTGDYDPFARTLFVRGKFNNERIIPVPDEAADVLDGYLDLVGRRPGPLFRSERYRHQGLIPQTVGIIVSRMMREAGLKRAAYDGRSAHALRHTAASDVLERSRDLRAVQQMLGHQSLATTERYLRVADLGRLRQAMAGRHYG